MVINLKKSKLLVNEKTPLKYVTQTLVPIGCFACFFPSSDGGIKIWDENKVLVTEVMLEDSLSAAAFLNDAGDLLVGFKNHIFYIDHSKCRLHLMTLFLPVVDHCWVSSLENVLHHL